MGRMVIFKISVFALVTSKSIKLFIHEILLREKILIVIYISLYCNNSKNLLRQSFNILFVYTYNFDSSDETEHLSVTRRPLWINIYAVTDSEPTPS